MAKHPVEGQPYYQECYRELRKEIAEAHNIVSSHTIKNAQNLDLAESEVVGIQEEMQRKLQVALHGLDR